MRPSGYRSLRRLLGYARPYRARAVAALVAMGLYGGASAYLAYLIKPIFDDVLIRHVNLPAVARLVIVFYLVKGIGAYLSAYLMSDVGQRVVMDVRNALYRHMLEQSAAFFARRPTGKLLSRITYDASQIQQAVSETMADLLRESLALFGYAFVLFYYDWRLALMCTTGAPLVLYPLVRMGKRLRRTTRRSQEEQESLSHVATEAFTGQRIVKAFGTEAHEARKFAAAAHQLFRTNIKLTKMVAALPPLMEFLGGLGIAAALWYGSRRIRAGLLTTGEFTSFMAAFFLMYGPAKKLSRVNANLQQAIAAAERIFEVLDIHTELRDAPGACSLPPMRRDILLRNVSFEYDGAHAPILETINLRAGPGQIIAIVGMSGAGKTTLVNLLPRFYDVSGGEILIDGVDIRQATLRSLRGQIGIVTQETILFNDTIRNNIAYGAPAADEEAVIAAARAAQAHDFILALPDGYATMIGERGQRLSGGQRQRLAIARALLKNPPILILDEATSALDAESELFVQRALINLMKGRTTFVIAHRLSTVRRADLIVVLDQGRIVEQGRHDDLLARPGVYAKLYELQYFGADEMATL